MQEQLSHLPPRCQYTVSGAVLAVLGETLPITAACWTPVGGGLGGAGTYRRNLVGEGGPPEEQRQPLNTRWLKLRKKGSKRGKDLPRAAEPSTRDLPCITATNPRFPQEREPSRGQTALLTISSQSTGFLPNLQGSAENYKVLGLPGAVGRTRDKPESGP